MPDDENLPADEPHGVYSGSKKITVFRSIQEENEHTYRQYAAMTPEECLATVTRMRLNASPHLDTDLRPWGNTIYFD